MRLSSTLLRHTVHTPSPPTVPKKVVRVNIKLISYRSEVLILGPQASILEARASILELLQSILELHVT